MAAAAKPNQLPKTNPPKRTLADTVAIARAKGDFRQKHSKPLSPAEAEASARHDDVTYQIKQLFLRSEAGDKIAAVPGEERYRVFQNELCCLHDELVKILTSAIVAYVKLAITHRSELPDDSLAWVKAQVDADLAMVRGWWEQWVRCVVSLNPVVSFNTDVPAWINYPELHLAFGRLPSDIELGAALPDAEGVLETIWLRFRLDLGKAVDGVLLDEKGKLDAVPTTVQAAVSTPVQPTVQSSQVFDLSTNDSTNQAKILKILRKPHVEGTHIEWSGPLWKLAELVSRLFNENKIKATSNTNALEQACKYFVSKKHMALNADSLRENLRRHQEKNEGKL